MRNHEFTRRHFIKLTFTGIAGAAVGGTTFASLGQSARVPDLKVSENKHFLITETGQPFFWLGDTAWELFHRGRTINAWWFDPRTGKTSLIAKFSNTPQREFTPPDVGEARDWVLVLDDASREFPPPGTVNRIHS